MSHWSKGRDHIERLFKVVQMCSLVAAIGAVGVKAHSAIVMLAFLLFMSAWIFAVGAVLDYLTYLEEEGDDARALIMWVKRRKRPEIVEFGLIITLLFGMLAFVGWLTLVIFKALPG